MPRRAALKIMQWPRVNLASADVPGPPQPLYLAGAWLLEVFPMLPLMAKTTLGVSALSYAGQFDIMTVADHDTLPQPRRLHRRRPTRTARTRHSHPGHARP